MKSTTIAAAGLILLESVLVHCQDSAGLMRLAANVGIFADTGNAISTNSSVDQNCLSDLPEVVIAWLQHFNAIVLETFVVSSGHSISGPLYVQGQFIGQSYSVNGQSTVDCGPENEDIISKTGLVIDFTTGVYLNIALNGNAYIPRASAVTVLQESANCVIYQTGYFGPVTFSTMVAALATIEKALINLPITLQIKSDGTMVDANPRTDPRFDKLQFSPCTYQSCPVGLVTDSEAGVVLFNGAEWKGPTNRAYPDDSIIVFSIPVWENFFIYLTTDSIGAGVQPCRAIYHFYPVSGNPNVPNSGVYNPTGQAEVVRDGKGYLAGLTFAPKMVLSDGDIGGFAGQVVGKAYQWRNPAGGADILNYDDTGDVCQGKFVCYPPTNYTRPPITTHSVTITETTIAEETSTLQDTITVTLPTDSETTVYVDFTHYITVHLTVTDTTTQFKPGYYITFTEEDDTTTTTETTSTLTNTHTEIQIIYTVEQEISTITELQATATTTTNTNIILVPRPTSTTITEHPTIYITAYETVTLTVTETEHTGSIGSSESDSQSSSNSNSLLPEPSKLKPSSSSSREPGLDVTDECTQAGDHKTHHHHHHHGNEEDCENESHHHHHKDEEKCEDKSHHHFKNDDEKGDGDQDESDDEEEEDEEKDEEEDEKEDDEDEDEEEKEEDDE